MLKESSSVFLNAFFGLRIILIRSRNQDRLLFFNKKNKLDEMKMNFKKKKNNNKAFISNKIFVNMIITRIICSFD